MTKKIKSKKKTIVYGTVSPNVKDYSNEPFFIKKAEDSKKVIAKYGLPKEFLTGNNKK
jgi:hypothetical protein